MTLALQCSNPVEVPSGQPDTLLTQPQDWQLQLSRLAAAAVNLLAVRWFDSCSEVVTKIPSMNPMQRVHTIRGSATAARFVGNIWAYTGAD